MLYLMLSYVLMVAIYVVLPCTVDMIRNFNCSSSLEQVFFPHTKDGNSGANNRNNDNFHKAVWIILERQVYVCPPQADMIVGTAIVIVKVANIFITILRLFEIIDVKDVHHIHQDI